MPGPDESGSEPQSADLHPANSMDIANPVASTEQEPEGLVDGLSTVENGNGLTDANAQVVETTHGQKINGVTGSSPRASVTNHPVASAHDVLVPVDGISAREEESQLGDDSSSDLDPDTDVAMEEAAGSSSEENEGGSADDYEPTEAGIELNSQQSPAKPASSSHIPHEQDAVLETSDADLQGVSATSPVTQPISAADEDSASVFESGREVDLLDHDTSTRA